MTLLNETEEFTIPLCDNSFEGSFCVADSLRETAKEICEKQGITLPTRKILFLYIDRNIPVFQNRINSHNMIEMSMSQKNCHKVKFFFLNVCCKLLRMSTWIHYNCILCLFIYQKVTICPQNPKGKLLYLHCFFFPPSLLFSQYRSRHQSDAVYQLLLQVPLGHAQ